MDKHLVSLSLRLITNNIEPPATAFAVDARRRSIWHIDFERTFLASIAPPPELPLSDFPIGKKCACVQSIDRVHFSSFDDIIVGVPFYTNYTTDKSQESKPKYDIGQVKVFFQGADVG